MAATSNSERPAGRLKEYKYEDKMSTLTLYRNAVYLETTVANHAHLFLDSENPGFKSSVVALLSLTFSSSNKIKCSVG